MTFDEFLGDWDKDAYAASLIDLDEPQLRKLHYDIRQKVMRADAAVGAAGATAVFVNPVSLFGAGIGYRKRRYNAQKQDMIERRMSEMEWETSKLRKRDICRAVGPSAVAAAFVPGVDGFADHLLDHVAGDGAQYFVSNHTGDLLDAAVHHKAELLQGVGDGISAQLGTVFDAVSGNATDLVPLGSVASNSTAFLGNMAGQALAHTAEVELASSLAKGALSLGLDILLGSKINVNTSSVSTQNSHGKPIEYVDTPVAVKQYKRGRKPKLQFGFPENGRDEEKDWVDNEPMLQTRSQDVAIPEKHNMKRPIFTEVFFLILYPALINLFCGLKVMIIANLLPVAYNFRHSRKIATHDLCYISFPAITAWLFGNQALWYATFCLQLLMTKRILQFRMIECYEVVLVFLPLVFCTSGKLAAFVLGIHSIAILGAFTEWCVTEEDSYKEPKRYFFYLDFHALYFLVGALFSTGAAKSYFSGCACTAFVLSILQFVDGRVRGNCLLGFRKFLVKDLNRIGRAIFLFVFGASSGMICILAGAAWFWFVLVGGLGFTMEKLHKDYGHLY